MYLAAQKKVPLRGLFRLTPQRLKLGSPLLEEEVGGEVVMVEKGEFQS